MSKTPTHKHFPQRLPYLLTFLQRLSSAQTPSSPLSPLLPRLISRRACMKSRCRISPAPPRPLSPPVNPTKRRFLKSILQTNLLLPSMLIPGRCPRLHITDLSLHLPSYRRLQHRSLCQCLAAQTHYVLSSTKNPMTRPRPSLSFISLLVGPSWISPLEHRYQSMHLHP